MARALSTALAIGALVACCGLLLPRQALAANSTNTTAASAVRGMFLDFVDDPFYVPEDKAARWVPDGLLVISNNGTIVDFGNYSDIAGKYPGIPTTTYKEGNLIMPGFIDTHVHYVQSRVPGSFGFHVTEWLGNYIYPEELQFKNATYAREVASWFLDEMLRGGTTTMQTFTTTAKTATDVFFDEASKRNMRVIAGVTGVDHSEYKGQAPNGYEDTADTFFEDSVDMYNKWHGKGRNLYAVSPRYAPGSTNEQLAKAGYLFKTLPGVYMNTHMAEVMAEVVEIKKLFPNATDYYGVYQMHNLTGPRSTFGHSIYLTDSEFERIKKDGSSLAFCPASNLFLGSGLFKLAQAKGTKTPVRVSLGSDVAGGDTFSQLKVLNNGYKVGMLQNYPMSAFKLLFLPTLGSARALYLDDKLGSFNVGNEADFVVLNMTATREQAFRAQKKINGTDFDRFKFLVFGLATLGDERSVTATHVLGKPVYRRDARLMADDGGAPAAADSPAATTAPADKSAVSAAPAPARAAPAAVGTVVAAAAALITGLFL